MMMISRPSRSLLSMAAAVAILAGCNAAIDDAASMPPSNAARLTALDPRTVPTILRPDRSESRMKSTASGQKLLYVSDIGTNDVQVYDYPQGTNVGTLTGFNTPQGECTDSAGNVYITNLGSSQILEYAYGGTSPIATLTDPNGSLPVSCAVDPKSGNLAVANLLSSGSFEAGGVAIYPGGSGTPTIYADPVPTREYFLDYDNNGNIFVDGINGRTSAFRLTKLSPKGAFSHIKLKTKISYPGNVQYLGKYIAVGDQEGPESGKPDIYHVTPEGKVVGTTTLVASGGGRVGDVAQFTILAKGTGKGTIISPDAVYGSVYIDQWPGGAFGSAITADLVQPVGAVISAPAPK
jgi:hypothetical protein